MTSPHASLTPHLRPDLAELPAYVPGKSVPGALKIASNEMTQPPLPSVAEAISEALQGPSTSPNRYPDMGAVALRTELAQHLGLEMEQVAVGCGSSALCLQIAQATCNDGDEVVFPWRSFEAYPILARIAGATPVAVPLDAQGRNDLDGLAAAVTERTRLIFVCNPNNPTGTTISADAFHEFMAKVPSNVVVALDEAYIELVDATERANTPLAHELVGQYPNLVGLRTFSKVYGLAGLRVGYLFGSEQLVTAVNKVAIPFSVNTIAQAAAVASLRAEAELEDRVQEVRNQRVRLTEAINNATGKATVLPDSQTNFVWISEADVADLGRLLPDVSGDAQSDKEASASAVDAAAGVASGVVDTANALGAYLAAKGILVRWFKSEGVRITVTTAAEVDQLLAALGLADSASA